MMVTRLTDEQLGKLRVYWGMRDPYEPRLVTYTVNFDEGHRDEWLINGFLEEFNRAVSEVPLEVRASARVKIGGGLSIEYDRLETDAEMEARIQCGLSWLRQVDALELATYERVKARLFKKVEVGDG
jgi:hypothetical protein